ncbi:homing endonuclease associated repeat-containing protein [Haloarcula nitratireducens]|uniref:C2H2-type zinc finger protein n=1 Tax=Haloarcula nitratireducens TaxID=2487749 RepID=A0AAW4PEQ6_9EURY|nr:C2H2-type zinc finger protein [Halomicroarcula nitratireducens]MBX0296841.1 C2H2-type zinc finger protein [Halomicroarcula nitratireducens]
MTGERDLTCDVCGKSFDTKDALGSHNSSHSRRISDTQLLTEIDRLVDDLGRSPTTIEMNELGAYSAGTYKNRFGSWAEALQEAGYEPVKQHRVSKDALIDEIRRLATEDGTPPTAADMRSEGEFTVTIAQNRFGSWNEALEAAGYDPNPRHRISDAELLEEIHRLADELGKIPTAQEMKDHGEFSHRPYFTRWEGWQAAIRAAGYEPVGRPDGPNHHNWKEQPVHKWREYGDNWDEQRQKALERDDYTCQTPGCEWTQEAHLETFTRGLHVHHIRPLSAFGDDESEVDFEQANRLDNLVTVCAEHHHLWEQASPLRLDTR